MIKAFSPYRQKQVAPRVTLPAVEVEPARVAARGSRILAGIALATCVVTPVLAAPQNVCRTAAPKSDLQLPTFLLNADARGAMQQAASISPCDGGQASYVRGDLANQLQAVSGAAQDFPRQRAMLEQERTKLDAWLQKSDGTYATPQGTVVVQRETLQTPNGPYVTSFVSLGTEDVLHTSWQQDGHSHQSVRVRMQPQADEYLSMTRGDQSIAISDSHGSAYESSTLFDNGDFILQRGDADLTKGSGLEESFRLTAGRLSHQYVTPFFQRDAGVPWTADWVDYNLSGDGGLTKQWELRVIGNNEHPATWTFRAGSDAVGADGATASEERQGQITSSPRSREAAGRDVSGSNSSVSLARVP